VNPRPAPEPRGLARESEISRAVVWTPAQRRKNDVIFAVARHAIRLGLTLPRAWLPPLGTLLGAAAHALFPSARATALANLALVHPELSPRARRQLGRDVFRALGRNLTDTLALLDPDEDPARTLSVSPGSERVLAEALAMGRGVVYATCHLGPWERMAALLAKRGFPITTIARESYDPRFHALVYDRLRERRDVRVIYRKSTSAPVAIVRTLRAGRVLGLLVDLPGSIPTRDVEWLGRPARMASGLARLALRLGAPVVVGTPAPAAGGLAIRVEAIPTGDLSSDERSEAELSQRVADALSERIRVLSTHWPWMFPSFTRAANTAASVTETPSNAGSVSTNDASREAGDERSQTARWTRVGV
jgi:KDO2-lipid IV(A) lauroyltransferase